VERGALRGIEAEQLVRADPPQGVLLVGVELIEPAAEEILGQ
jgi:hypothetical protein